MMRRFQQRKRQRTSIPEVSLTPLIDTALTLLIIFMVTTPMLHNAIKIELPQGSSQEAKKEPEQMIVSIDNSGKIFFNNKEVSIDSLGETIKTFLAQQKNADMSVWVHAHAKSPCELLVGVIDRVKVIGGIKDVNVAMQKITSTRA
jgi:biopolymer transport protein ExbD